MLKTDSQPCTKKKKKKIQRSRQAGRKRSRKLFPKDDSLLIYFLFIYSFGWSLHLAVDCI